MDTSTPVSVTSKKRFLTSPEEQAGVKKQLLSTSGQSLPSLPPSPTSAARDVNSGSSAETAGMSETLSLTDISSTVGAVPSMPSISLGIDECRAIASAIKDSFRDDIPGMLKVIMSDSVKSIVNGVLAGLNEKISALESSNQDLVEENGRLKARVLSLEQSADDLEQYSRRNCLRIIGIPESPDPDAEDTDAYVTQMCSDLEVGVDQCHIDRSHRLGKLDRSMPRAIIVKFATYRARGKLYRARPHLRNIGYKDVFVNEGLTKSRSSLLYSARQLVKQRKILGAWSSDGNILIKDSKGATKRVRHGQDLSKYEKVPESAKQKSE